MNAHMEQARRLHFTRISSPRQQIDRFVDATVLLENEPALEEEPSVDRIFLADAGTAEILVGVLERAKSVLEATRSRLRRSALAQDAGAGDALVGGGVVLPKRRNAIK